MQFNTVSNLGIEEETRASDTIARCLAREIRTWILPSELSPRTALSFPFTFGSRHDADDFDDVMEP